MFGRRRRRSDEESLETAAEETAEEAGAEPAEDRPHGPWDVSEPAPELTRVDLGALHVPVTDDLEVQLNLADDQVVAATVVHEGSALQLQAFAAPKTTGIWDDVRGEIAEGLGQAGTAAQETDGPFGAELRADVPVDAGEQGVLLQPARFVGVDGPRWFLRGVLTGPAVAEPRRAALLEEVFRGVVVVRGDAPMPPREPLELRLPPELQQQAAPEERRPPDIDPMRRGPEITETR